MSSKDVRVHTGSFSYNRGLVVYETLKIEAITGTGALVVGFSGLAGGTPPISPAQG